MQAAAVFRKVPGEHQMSLVPEAQAGVDFSAPGGGVLGAAQQRGHADAAPHHQQLFPGHVEAPAQGAQNVQLVAGLPAGEPLGALAPDLKDHPQGVPHPVADGDGPPEQAGVTALDVDKLAAGDLTGQLLPHVQGEGEGKCIELHRFRHGAEGLNRHGAPPG